MRIIAVSAEVAPWSKTGGLGDVLAALPVALAARGHRVMTVAPRHKPYDDAWDTGDGAVVPLFGSPQGVGFFHVKERGVDRVFVDHESLRRGGVYGDEHGSFADNQFRFALLCRAALEAARKLRLDGEVYGEDVVFYANDWHGALVPVYLDALYRPVGLFPKAAAVLGLHNLAHQGGFFGDTIEGLELPPRFRGVMDMDGHVNTLKGGLVAARKIIAVSPTYAQEIQTAEGGWGLDGILRARASDLIGIVNGIDTDEWNPENDPHIAASFSRKNLDGKAVCKAALQTELGLPVRPEVPLLGFIGRLGPQKGVDLIRAALPWLVRQDVQLVMLGQGSSELERFFREAEHQHHDSVRGWVGFSGPVAHRITAAADLLLMPSRFEPCGLNQLYAMRYGTLPIVHSTGGLRDTVTPFHPGEGTGTGWVFADATSQALVEAIHWALATYRNHAASFRQIQDRAMARDDSWNRAAGQYEQVFEDALAKR